MPKQLYIPLPCADARRAILDIFLCNDDGGGGGGGPAPLGDRVRASLSASELELLLRKTAGYSGSDMRALIQEASYGPVRELQRSAMAAAASSSSSSGTAAAAAMPVLTADLLRPVRLEDFRRAAAQQRRSVSDEEVKRYEECVAGKERNGMERQASLEESAADPVEDGSIHATPRAIPIHPPRVRQANHRRSTEHPQAKRIESTWWTPSTNPMESAGTTRASERAAASSTRRASRRTRGPSRVA